MLFLELFGFFVCAVYIISSCLGNPETGAFIFRLFVVAVASWIAEESCIFLYRFYHYNPSWDLFLGQVPWLIIIVWPIIIHSARDLASQLLSPGHRLVPFVAAAIVWTDASFIEPIAMSAGLWSWQEPGIFGVPPIGILGWGFFTFFSVFLLERPCCCPPLLSRKLLVFVLPALGTHVLLLGFWWGGFRWVNLPVNPLVTATAAWVLSLLSVLWVLRHGTGLRVRKKTLLLRAPAALLFFLLLAGSADASDFLVAYALAFTLPYLTLMTQQYFGSSPGTSGRDGRKP